MDLATHACGGTILSGGTGEQAHRYCDRCRAFAYGDEAVPNGTDAVANRAAWDAGEEKSPAALSIEIGNVTEEWVSDGFERDEFAAYVQVAVTIDDREYMVGTMVGVRESEQDNIRRSGAGVGPFLATWWADSSDWQHVGAGWRDAVADALLMFRHRLWREVEALRGV